jgi:hypothetical protein
MLFDDPGALDPEAVVWWHTLCTQALVRERQELRRVFALREPPPSYLPIHLDLGATEAEIDNYFRQCQEELDVSAVFNLIAAAEGRIRLDLRERVNAHQDQLGMRSTIEGRLRDSRGVPTSYHFPDRIQCSKHCCSEKGAVC